MAIEIGDDDIVLTEAAIVRLGGELRGKTDDPVKTARFDKATLGGLTLTDLEVVTQPAMESVQTVPGALLPGDGPKPDGSIGLGALEGLSWSILPSSGLLRVRTGSEGPALQAALGGEPVKLQRTASQKIEERSGPITQPAGQPLAAVALRAATPGVADPAPIQAVLRLSTGTPLSSVDRSVLGEAPAGAAEARYADRRARPLTVQLGAASSRTLVAETSRLAVYKQFEKNDIEAIVKGTIGADVLGQLDLAYDPATDSLAVKLAPQRVAHSPLPTRLADAEAALEKSVAETKDPAPGKPKGAATAWSAAASARSASGDIKGAVAAYQAAAQLDEKSCIAHLQLGAALLAVGEPAAAETSFSAASTLWHGWGDLSTEVRAALQKEVDKAKKNDTPYFFNADDIGFVKVADIREADVQKGGPPPVLPGDGAEIVPQPSACHRADAWLAAAAQALGRAGAAPKAYATSFDLDPNLALIAGNALLAKGEATAALAPYRQSVKSFGAPASPGLQRVGLALATAKSGGDPAAAAALAEKAAVVAPHDPLITRAYAELLLAAEGPAAATAALRSFARARPDSVAAQLAYHHVAVAAGDMGAVAEAKTTANGAAAMLRALDGEQPAGLAYQALVQAATGDPDTAANTAAEAARRAPGSALAYVAVAAAAKAKGDPAAEAEALKVAARLAPFHPVLAAR